MARLLARALTLAELEDDQLGTAELANDLALYRGTRDERLAELRRVAGDHENLVEFDFGTRIASEELNLNGFALCDSVLLAAGADDCVGHGNGARNLIQEHRTRKHSTAILSLLTAEPVHSSGKTREKAALPSLAET